MPGFLRIDTGVALLLGALLVLVVTPAPGQGLDIHPRPDPPATGSPSYRSALMDRLQQEMTDLNRIRYRGDDRARLIRNTRIDLRVMAGACLESGESTTAFAAGSFVHGLRLAGMRHDLDEALATMEEEVIPEERLDGLFQFSERMLSLQEVLAAGDMDELDAALVQIMRPLGVVLGFPADEQDLGFWPSVADMGTGSAVTPAESPPPSSLLGAINDLHGAWRDAAIPEESRSQALDLLELLRRGAVFDSLRIQVTRITHALWEVMRFLEQVEAASWLPPSLAEDWRTDVADSIELLRHRDLRPLGLVRAERCASMRAQISQVERLRGRGLDAGRLSRVIDLCAEASLPAAADGAEKAPGFLDTSLLDRYTSILSLMLRARIQSAQDTPQEYRVIRRNIEQRYRETERSMLASGILEDLVTDPTVMADPARSSLLLDQSYFLMAIERLARFPDYTARASIVDVTASDLFQARLRRSTQEILEHAKRPAAEEALRALSQGMNSYYPIPGEEILNRTDALVNTMTGGQQDRLRALIYEAREEWINDWAEAYARGEGAGKLDLMCELLRAMRDGTEVVSLGGSVGSLNDWAAWELPDTLLARGVQDLPNRLRLASSALVAGRRRQCREQIDAIDRDLPLVQLIGRLSVLLAKPFSGKEDGLAAALRQMTMRPGEDAWLLHRRHDFGLLCRYALETDHARMTGQDETLIDDMQAYVNAIARDILVELRGIMGS